MAVARALSQSGRVASSQPRSATKLVGRVLASERAGRLDDARSIAVYPSRDLLPENLLRFYIHFSAPMSRGEAYRRIKLLDTTGKPVDSPFLELDEELWSSDGTRFTLLFDPGRIKRGLKPREELGPVLEAGKSYSLVIDRDWPDAQGNPLTGRVSQDLSGRSTRRDLAGPEEPGAFDSPRAEHARSPGSSLPEPLDRALLDRLIAVQDADGKVVPGRVSLPAGDDLAIHAREPVASGRLSPGDRNRAGRRGGKQRCQAVRGRCRRPDLAAGHDRDGRPTVSDRPRAAVRARESPASARVAQPVVEIRWA